MKKIALYINMIGFLFLLGCNEDFLETQPTDRYTEDIFWKTEGHALAGVNACYTALTSTSLYNTATIILDVITPNAYGVYSGMNLIAGSTHDAANTAIINGRYDANYTGVGRTNIFLVNIDQVNMDESLKSRMKGEAKFLRGLYYFDLVTFYGGVPLILDAPNLEQYLRLPRESKAKIIEQVLKDLDEASELLPLTYEASDQGRVTKGAALALKARVLLYEGKWDEAAAAAKAVMDLNQYSLFPDYRGLFMVENEGNDEVIFDVQFKAPELGSNVDVTLDQFKSSIPLQDLVDAYLMIDGKPMEESPWYDPNNPYDNKDPRFYATIVYPGAMFKGKVFLASESWTGYSQKKYTVYKDNEVPAEYISAGGRSELNYILLRYADILLMYAEAQNEAVGPDATVYAALKEIRDRAGMPAVEDGLSKDAMREVIRHERRIELAGEGLYYNDIKRWKIAENVNNGPVYTFSNEKLLDRSFDPISDYLWPIPSVAIEQNPALEQNPGYGL